MNDLIVNRYSPKDFDPAHEMSEADIELLLGAARWAPSSYNEQPWKFYYAKSNTSGHSKLYNAILDGNKPWSGDASLLILGVAVTTFSRNGKTNRHAAYDLGQSVSNLILQATELGLHAHQMGGFSVDQAKENLQLPANEEPMVMIALGKRIGSDRPNRSRKDIDEISVDLG